MSSLTKKEVKMSKFKHYLLTVSVALIGGAVGSFAVIWFVMWLDSLKFAASVTN